MPPSDGQLSMFETTDMEETAVWRHEEEHGRDKKALARVDVEAKTIADVRTEAGLQLTLVLDKTPPRHVTVTGWTDVLATKKEFAQAIAKCLQPGDTKVKPTM